MMDRSNRRRRPALSSKAWPDFADCFFYARPAPLLENLISEPKTWISSCDGEGRGRRKRDLTRRHAIRRVSTDSSSGKERRASDVDVRIPAGPGRRDFAASASERHFRELVSSSSVNRPPDVCQPARMQDRTVTTPGEARAG